MVTYGGMSKKPITVSTSSFIFKVHVEDCQIFAIPSCKILLCSAEFAKINSEGKYFKRGKAFKLSPMRGSRV